jgi:hypothetical protein
LGPSRGGVAPGGRPGDEGLGHPSRSVGNRGWVMGGGVRGSDLMEPAGAAAGVESGQGRGGAVVAGELERGVLLRARRPGLGVEELLRLGRGIPSRKPGGVAQAQASPWRAAVVSGGPPAVSGWWTLAMFGYPGSG